MPDTPAPAPESATPAAPTPPSNQNFADRLASRVANAFAGPAPVPAAPVPETPPAVPAAAAPETPPATPPAVLPTDEGTPDDIIAAIPEEVVPPDGPDLPIDEPEEEETPAAETKEDRAWGKVKTELAETKKQLTARDAAIAQLESRVKELAGGDATDWKAKATELEQQLGVVKLEASPAYVQAVDAPIRAIVSRLDAIAAEYGIDPGELSDAVSISDKKVRAAKVDELVGGLAPHDRLEVHTLGRDADAIFAKKDELIKNHDKVLAELEEEARKVESAAAATRAAERVAAVDLVIPRIVAKIPELKDFLGTIQDELKETDFDALPPHLKAYNAAAGRAVPKLQKQILQLRKDLQEALNDVSATRSASPKIGDTPAATPPANPNEKIGDRLARKLQAAAPIR